jgi:hypothetical protein
LNETQNDQEPIEKAELEAPSLAPCPCGVVPENLLIEMPERAKYGRTMGDCCGEWSVEFRNGYTTDPNLTTERARRAWNEAPRQVS